VENLGYYNVKNFMLFGQYNVEFVGWEHNYQNFRHYPSSYFLFKNTTFRKLDSITVFRWKTEWLVPYIGPIRVCSIRRRRHNPISET
jgi:hypothetical protein